MKNETLDAIRKQYESGKFELENYNYKKTLLKQMEETETIKKYIAIKEEVAAFEYKNKFNDKTERTILFNSIRHYEYKIDEEDTNKIYVYLGTFKITDEVDIVHSPPDHHVKRDDPKADYSLYWDIENHDISFRIKIKDRESFEKNHKIIFPKDYIYFKEAWYWDLQKEFFKLAIENGQEEACKEFLEKYQ